MAEWIEFRPRELLGTLVARGVDFVVVGGLAAVFHGSPRLTQDVDLCYSIDPANTDVLGRTLIELDAKLFGIEDEVGFLPDAKTLRRIEILTLDTKLGKLDLLRAPAGAPPYEELRAKADTIDLGEFAVKAASAQHLIAMKRATGRAKDLADIEELEALREVRGDPGG